ncbi:MAG: hypothetical protein KAV87_22475 [Desulfobacteraceae bacterium]|nr:hypothetical protein [Desulfobacteraceae bacterium]
MSTIKKNKINTARRFGGAPYGNLSSFKHNMTLNASGVVVDSDDDTALAIADKVQIGVLPAGMTLEDWHLIISDVFKAASACKIGFEYVDGVDDANVPQDDDYFFATATVLTAAAVLRKVVANPPVVLPKDAYIIWTHEGALADEASVVDFVVNGELTGQP